MKIAAAKLASMFQSIHDKVAVTYSQSGISRQYYAETTTNIYETREEQEFNYSMKQTFQPALPDMGEVELFYALREDGDEYLFTFGINDYVGRFYPAVEIKFANEDFGKIFTTTNLNIMAKILYRYANEVVASTEEAEEAFEEVFGKSISTKVSAFYAF